VCIESSFFHFMCSHLTIFILSIVPRVLISMYSLVCFLYITVCFVLLFIVALASYSLLPVLLCGFLCDALFLMVLAVIAPLRRPRQRWENGIRIDLREICWGSVEWIQLAQDRGRWRALVNTAMNLRMLAPRS
jgi:hypothetical protein